ncbi:MAG: uroporphyrinogen-III C-methyltransferase [Gammaproteobacteria bacterium]|nr:uroporphyrinogen-III C-methyltransferase [Gammaproteobacteria bacterium]
MTKQQNVNIKSNGWRNFFLASLVPIIAIALVFGGYFGQRYLEEKISGVLGKSEELSFQLKQTQEKYDQQQIVLLELQSEIQNSNSAKTKSWKPTIIEHLLQMADLTLNTTGDVKLAISYLQTAKQYANTQELSAIKHSLNKDIASLQGVPAVNDSELVLKIDAVSQKINALPIVSQQFTVLQKKSDEEETPVTTLWQRFFSSTTKALKDILVIRHHNIEPLVSPEQETILRLSVQTKLLQAEWAVMHRQNNLYHSCLEETMSLIAKYFAASDVANTDIFVVLKELQGVDLQPKLPFLSESMAIMQNFMSANKEQEVLPSQPQPSLPASSQNQGDSPL